MRKTFALFLLLLAVPALAEPRLFPAPEGTGDTVTIYSTLDERLAVPLIAAFQVIHPTTAIAYVDLLAGDIAARIRAETEAGGPTADLAISTAMDLQVKLANDGLARAVTIPQAADWPRWANWRDTAFALTVEPAVLVWHRPSFPDGPPETRLALMDWLRDVPPDGPPVIGTYDIEGSAVGYLYLARDAEHFPDIWTLVAVMGAAGLETYSTSQDIISRVAAGDLALGYNVLGSYAADQLRTHPDLGLVMLRDYTVAISRVALVPRAAANPDGGTAFLAFLMSDTGQGILSRDLALPAVSLPATGPLAADPATLRPVNVSAGLLAYLDQAKRRLILDRWHAATGQ
jgi:iron(III) transport system substrate-binding protein